MKTIKERFLDRLSQIFIFVFPVLVSLLMSCGSNISGLSGNGNNFNSSVPVALTSIMASSNGTPTAVVVVDQGTPNQASYNLVLSADGNSFTGNITGLSLGSHTFKVYYYIDQVEIAYDGDSTLINVVAGPQTITPTPGTLRYLATGITVSPLITAILPPGKVAFTASATFLGTTTPFDVTSSVTWASSQTTDVFVTPDGIATGTSLSSNYAANITATLMAVTTTGNNTTDNPISNLAKLSICTTTPVQVPSTVGTTYNSASYVGLVPTESEIRDYQPLHTVLSTDPPPGSEVCPGTAITVYTSDASCATALLCIISIPPPVLKVPTLQLSLFDWNGINAELMKNGMRKFEFLVG